MVTAAERAMSNIKQGTRTLNGEITANRKFLQWLPWVLEGWVVKFRQSDPLGGIMYQGKKETHSYLGCDFSFTRSQSTDQQSTVPGISQPWRTLACGSLPGGFWGGSPVLQPPHACGAVVRRAFLGCSVRVLVFCPAPPRLLPRPRSLLCLSALISSYLAFAVSSKLDMR